MASTLRCVLLGLVLCSFAMNVLSQTCPPGVPVVQCLVNPCATTPPPGCAGYARCEPDYCGACGRHYYASNGTEMCTECPVHKCGAKPTNVSSVCRDGSTSGYTGRCLLDLNGDSCYWEYRQCDECASADCANVNSCPSGSTLIRTGCCSSCVSCAAVSCAAVACGEGFESFVPQGQCCPQCRPRNSKCGPVCAIFCEHGNVLDANGCPTCQCKPAPATDCRVVLCPPVICGSNEVKIKAGCCETCAPAVPCDNIVCTAVECPEGTKKIFPQGACCPVCERVPDCSAVACLAVTCTAGFESVVKDLSCCPTCEEINRCADVTCSAPRGCSSSAWITRPGECCPNCPTCTPDADGRTTCDQNDNEVCTPGYFAGASCQTQVNPDDRVEVVTDIEICPCPSTSEQENILITERKVAQLAGVDVKYVDVSQTGTRSGCCSFHVRIFNSKSASTEVNPIQAQSTLLANIQDSSQQTGMRVSTSAQQSAAAHQFSIASILVLLLASSILYALM